MCPHKMYPEILIFEYRKFVKEGSDNSALRELGEVALDRTKVKFGVVAREASVNLTRSSGPVLNQC